MAERKTRPARGGRAEQTTISAGLVKIFGVGTLILGDSGIGKSESALELISRGPPVHLRRRRPGSGRTAGGEPVAALPRP